MWSSSGSASRRVMPSGKVGSAAAASTKPNSQRIVVMPAFGGPSGRAVLGLNLSGFDPVCIAAILVRLPGRSRPVLRKQVFEPEIVMLLRPVVIHLASPHRLERALHSERADIDVTWDQGDEQHGDH